MILGWGILIRSTSDRLPSPVFLGFPWAQLVKKLPAMQETWVRSLGLEDPLEKGKAARSSLLAFRIPWILYSMGSQRVVHDRATFTSLSRDITEFRLE